MSKLYIVWGVSLVVVAALFYYFGSMSVQPEPFVPGSFPTVTGAPSQNAAYASSATGIVVSHTSSSITLTLADGSTKQFTLAPNVQVLATVSAGQQLPTLATLGSGMLVSLLLSTNNGQSVVTSITLAPSPQATTTFSH